MTRRKKSNKKKSPIAVSVIGVAIVVLFLLRLYQVYEPLVRQNVFKDGITGPLSAGWRLTTLGSALLSSLTYLGLSLAGLFVLIGFLRLRRWSWVLLMAWTGVSLVISLVDYFYSHPNYAVMASRSLTALPLRSAHPTWNCCVSSSRWCTTPKANSSSPRKWNITSMNAVCGSTIRMGRINCWSNRVNSPSKN